MGYEAFPSEEKTSIYTTEHKSDRERKKIVNLFPEKVRGGKINRSVSLYVQAKMCKVKRSGKCHDLYSYAEIAICLNS